jgi:hypothetical protein
MATKYIRNNTSFQYIVKEFIKTVSKDDILQHHQKIVVDFIMKYSNLRGLLIYHKMGSGKTITSIAICETLQKKFPTYKKIILVPRSLRGNIIKNMEKINVDATNYIFISSNANNFEEQLRRKFYDLNNSIIVIDEAHNITNAIINGSHNATSLYNMIMEATNIKIILLTGTVIVNDPFELVPLFNMLSGYIYINGKKITLLPEYYDIFNSYFVNNKDKSFSDIKFMSRINGLTSYYEGSEAMPLVKDLIIERVPMSAIQYSQYIIEKKHEEDTISFAIKSNNKLSKSASADSSYKIKTRQLSNCYYPDEEQEIIIIDGKKNITKDAFKLTSKFYEKIADTSPKIELLYKIVEKNKKTKGFIYSQFLHCGLYIIGGYLSYKGYKVFKLDEKQVDNANYYCYITGDIEPELRDRYINIFNSEKNINGNLIKLLLISAAGSEGISLNATRWCILFEGYWNSTRLNQVIHRGIRHDSHLNLPNDERNMQPYLLLAKTLDDNLSTDEEIYNSATENQKNINRYLNLVKKTSIDCLNTEDCFICQPTNMPLYIEDIALDIESPIICEKILTEDIKVTSIIIKVNTSNGLVNEEYFYTKVNNKIRIFQWNKTLNIHEELFINNPLFKLIRDEILK